jgi:OOP family OmpA-OmpF porin
MKKKSIQAFLLVAITLLFAGCAGMRAMEPPLVFSPHTFPAGQYTEKVDNVLFILDASYTMDENGERDFVTAKNAIGAINQSLPTDLTFNGGLRTFGHHSMQSEKLTNRVFGMTKYTRDGLQKGLDGVKYAGGNSPMPEALEAASDDLRGARGKTAIIVISDGLIESMMSGAPEAAAKLKGEMGDNLCIYTIAVGGNPDGEKFLQEVAKAGGCGFSETAASLSAPGKLASFVERVFLSKKATAAAAAGPRDSDGDGVIDARDKCPDTPKGEIVDENGCSLKLSLHINFDFDKSDIKPEFAAELQRAGDFVLANKDVPYIVITGYADSVGGEAYNQKLSERRATAVRQYLIDNFGIGPDRLAARGIGESNPVAHNNTAEGRYENRRVEIVCCALLPPLK